jgi:hypothetical protein
MTYEQLKKVIVEDKNLIDKKGFKWFLIRWALLVFGVGFAFILPTFSLLGSRFAIVVLLIAALLFITVLSLIIDDPNSFKKVNKITKFWWLAYILVVVIYLVLKYWNFV